ncbi:Rhodanese-related sulfurtransferase [Salmonella enterica subsp. enterica serovar Uganda str. R8-3404]|uniref:Rhodanese-related sulfurtransferase n=1 Tax=Salmonella enterica subsp. enterica serovar Uganda str. R8-3404 TaxID=913083 RepID=A0A6C8H0X9_SALET|nr:Rhodanese-related sulfurtransferase [Salmonella enterica subsp. enterica serovar Uganda str. R8-3404]
MALPEEEQRRRRAGRENGNKIFNKSRGRLNSKLSIPDPAE